MVELRLLREAPLKCQISNRLLEIRPLRFIGQRNRGTGNIHRHLLLAIGNQRRTWLWSVFCQREIILQGDMHVFRKQLLQDRLLLRRQREIAELRILLHHLLDKCGLCGQIKRCGEMPASGSRNGRHIR